MTILEQIEKPVEQKEDLGSSVGHQLTRGSLLARNTVWNLVGQFAPMLVAVVVIPRLIRGLGTDRFGALTIAWMVVGYFSLFDLGLGRALTNLVAQKLASGEEEDLPAVIWTANTLMILLGLLGVIVFAAASPIVVHRVLKVPPALQKEILRSFYILSGAVPFVVSMTGFRGVLEAKQRFKVINAIRVPLGIVTFAAPLAVVTFSSSLVPVVAVLALARALACGLHAFLMLQSVPALRHRFRFDRAMLPKLLSFGGWMTVTNVVGPLMVNVDRFLIGALVSMSAVAYYATPYEMVTKLWVLPLALATVLFPAFSSSSRMLDQNRTAHLFDRSANSALLLMFLPCFSIVAFAHAGMRLWLGESFASQSFSVMQLLCIGVFVNGIAQVPFALIQGMGRPDLTAKLHLAELAFYAGLVWWLTVSFGIRGTAIAWAIRALLDLIALLAIVVYLLPVSARAVRDVSLRTATALAFFAGAFFTSGIPRIAFAAFTTTAFVVVSWKSVLKPQERAVFARFAKLMTARFSNA